MKRSFKFRNGFSVYGVAIIRRFLALQRIKG